MLVCHCHRVNDRVIRSLARGGARSCDDVGTACGAGTGCGGCRQLVARLVARERGLHGSAPVGVRAPEEGV